MTIGLYPGADPRTPGDTTFVFNANDRTLKYFHTNGMLQWSVSARGKGAHSGYGRDADTPPGLYRLGKPQPIPRDDADANAFGPWFVSMEPLIASKAVANKREGLGIHGGGSDLRNPLAPRQGWERTKGCIRLQNADLDRLAGVLNSAVANGRSAWVHVQYFHLDEKGRVAGYEGY